jgi:diguanylate cyclase (GGDEF)-like protein
MRPHLDGRVQPQAVRRATRDDGGVVRAQSVAETGHAARAPEIDVSSTHEEGLHRHHVDDPDTATATTPPPSHDVGTTGRSSRIPTHPPKPADRAVLACRACSRGLNRAMFRADTNTMRPSAGGNEMTEVSDPGEPADVAMRLIERAQSGGAQAVLAEAESLLRSATGELADGAPDVHFARAVALDVLGDARGALAAADLVVSAAVRDASPGWRSCGLSLRADARLRLGEQDAAEHDLDAVLRDLVDAESAIAEGESEPALAAHAHTGIGLGYHQLRLYELAVPHHEAAVELSSAAADDGDDACMWLLNLTHLHLDWALELYRVGQRELAETHSRAAESLAEAACGRASGVDRRRWCDMALLLAACARADGPDPHAALADIEKYGARVAAHGMAVEFSGVAPFHAVALSRSGRLPDALDLIEGALGDLASSAPWTAVAAATHTRALLLAASGSMEAKAALEYGDALAQALWRQRLRTLHVATTMQSYENLRTEHERVAHSARTDALTGIANRRAFDATVQALQDLPDRYRSVAVLLVDLDRFKEINDSRGHDAGDEVLRQVAASLATNLRDGDLVARLGGDEFAAVLPGAPLPAALSVARRMVEAVDAIVGCPTTASIGVAAGPPRELPECVVRADRAMYEAKRRGGNQVGAA